MLRARIFALLAAIALLLPSGALARPHYFCHMMERVLADSCCASQSEHGTQRQQPQVQGDECCERLLVPARAGASAASDVASEVPVAALVAVLSPYELVLLPAGEVRVAEQWARAPPGARAALFLANCALLS